jgi:hypothetical protein
MFAEPWVDSLISGLFSVTAMTLLLVLGRIRWKRGDDDQKGDTGLD